MPTTAENFPDGTLLDFVRVDGNSQLLVWRNGRHRISKQFQFGNRTYEPMSLDATTFDAIRFPNGVASCGSREEFFGKIQQAVSKFCGLTERELRSVTYFALSSLFPEVLPTPPTLVVTGPSPAEAHRFLRLLRCFCRRGVLVTELTPWTFLNLPMHLQPTLLIEQSKLARQLRGLLRAASNHGAFVPRAGGFLDLCCIKAVYTTEADLNEELREGVLRVSLLPAASNVPCFDASEEERLSAEFQPRLLQYRLQNFRLVQECRFDVPGFSTGVRELARALGASVLGDPNLTSGITSLLSAQDEDVRASWTTHPDFAIVVTLLAFVHEKRELRLPVKKLTDFVNATLKVSGEIKEFSPVEIGRLLSRLNILRSRSAGGMVIQLTRDVSRRVHDLKRRYGVTTTPASFPGCPDCEPGEAPGDRQLM